MKKIKNAWTAVKAWFQRRWAKVRAAGVAIADVFR